MNAPKPLNVFACALSGVINVEASAGTGKTWNICGLYLRLVVEQKRKPSEILVVTFTEAATAELRDRIRSRLAEVWRALQYNQMPEGDPFVQDFIQNCIAATHSGLTQDEAKRLIEAALLSFDEAAIFTIHGFCHRALSESAFSSGQPFQSEVATSGDNFIEQIAQDFWRRNIAPRSGTEVLQLVDYFPSESKDDRKKRKGKEVTSPLEPLGFGRVLKEVVGRPLALLKWPDTPAPIDPLQLQESIAAARLAVNANIGPALEKLKASIAAGDLNRTYYKSVESIDTAAAIWQQCLGASDVDFRELVGAELLIASNIQQRTKKGKAAPFDPLFDLLDTCYRRLEQHYEHAQHLRHTLLKQFIEESPSKLAKAKQLARVITFDDMLHKLYDALAGSAPAANLAQLLRQRFPCALIDEFQDTDPLQLEIFRAIYGTTGPLFLVGDPKQAIYSFRGADLRTYLSARNAAQDCFTLAQNQRSTKTMIGAVNALFGANDRPFQIDDLGFSPVEVGTKPIPPLVDESGVARSSLSVWHLKGGAKEDPLMIGEARKQIFKATVAEIVRLLAAGQQNKIRIGQRELQPRDIALLVRTNRQGRELKIALSAAGVNAVELSQSDVFASFEADEMERVLFAVADPANTRHLRGALATVLMGQDSTEIAGINNDEQLLGGWTSRFHEYRDTWQKHGFGRLWRDILTKEKVIERLLPLPGGERRATNLSHLAELLAAQYRRQPGIESLLKWFAERRRLIEGTETQQLRLESDQNLVQIVTKHRSKGLEYPIVFCPFAFDDGRSRSDGGHFHRYYDSTRGKTVLDFRGDVKGVAYAKQISRRESAEERLRVLYVALTRSIYRCYIAGGTHFEGKKDAPSSKASARSALNWLVAGKGHHADDWDAGDTSLEHIDACWDTLKHQAAGSIDFITLPNDKAQPRLESSALTTQYAAKTLSKKIPGIAWRLDSYSGLIRQQAGEYAAIDHDAVSPASTFASRPEPSVTDNDILRFSRGTLAGECVHTVFEKADFTRPDRWPGVIDKALRHHFGMAALPEAGRLQTMLADVLSTPLPGGWMLKEVSPQRRFTEFDFFFSVDRVKAAALFDLLEAHGWRGKRISFGTLNGFMRGSIDFICEHAGYWYLIDWKSNYLGGSPDDYSPERINDTMHEASYDLQAIIYLVALHRYLRARLGAHYSAKSNLGGALYLFIRGVRPSWPGEGIWHWQPPPALIEDLDALFSSQGERSAA